MVRLPSTERLPKGKAWKKPPFVEAKCGGQCGLRKALPGGQGHPGNIFREPTGKAEGKGMPII